MLEHGGVVAALVLFAIIEGFVIWVYDKRLRLSTESALAIQENSFKQMMVIDARSSEQKSELINSLKANTDVIKSVLDTLHSNSDTLRSNTEAVRTLSEKVAVLSDRTARE
jgi:methyl-accepting chemotaxis protein